MAYGGPGGSFGNAVGAGGGRMGGGALSGTGGMPGGGQFGGMGGRGLAEHLVKGPVTPAAPGRQVSITRGTPGGPFGKQAEADAWMGSRQDVQNWGNTPFENDIGWAGRNFLGVGETMPRDPLQGRADWSWDPAGFLGGLAGMAFGGPAGLAIGQAGSFLGRQISNMTGNPLSVSLGPDPLRGIGSHVRAGMGPSRMTGGSLGERGGGWRY